MSRAHILGIDHAVIAVRDLAAAHEVFARLGFTQTPRGAHTLGSQNHCIMFGTDYLELLTPPRGHPAMAYYEDFLARGDGLAAIALATDDAVAAQESLVAADIAADQALDFSRPVEPVVATDAPEARFRIVQLSPEQTPGCRMFLCQHFTREIVWRPAYQRHAVGALGIAAIALVVQDPARTAPGYAKVFDAWPQPIDEGLLVQTGGAPIALTARWKLGRRLEGVELPARPRPLVAALFIRVADRAVAARVLRAGGFQPVALNDGSFAIHAAEACGVTLVFG